MSWKASAYVKQLTVAPNGAPLTRTERLLLLVLAESHTDHEPSSSLSLELLASAASLSDERAQLLLARLQHKGVIARHDRAQNLSRSVSFSFPGLEP